MIGLKKAKGPPAGRVGEPFWAELLTGHLNAINGELSGESRAGG